jgi:hypothetical protein
MVHGLKAGLALLGKLSADDRMTYLSERVT